MEESREKGTERQEGGRGKLPNKYLSNEIQKKKQNNPQGLFTWHSLCIKK